MYRFLSDLRILRLALHLEEVLEGYEESLRNQIPFVPVRARLAVLFEEGAAHAALRRAVLERSREAAQRQLEASPEDILQTLFECEKAAHDFYLFYLDRLSDPELVKLFRQMGDEERTHMSAVAAAIQLLGHLPHAPAPGAPGPVGEDRT